MSGRDRVKLRIENLILLLWLNPKSESRNPKQIQKSNDQNTKCQLPLDGRFCFENSYFGHSILFRISDFVFRIIVPKE